MKRPDTNKLDELRLLALGASNLAAALLDPYNSGSVASLDYLTKGMDNRLNEIARTWETIRAGIYR